MNPSTLSARLPRLHCAECIELDKYLPIDHSVETLYEDLRIAQLQRRFGLPQIGQVVMLKPTSLFIFCLTLNDRRCITLLKTVDVLTSSHSTTMYEERLSYY